jgi:hypothetical protein
MQLHFGQVEQAALWLDHVRCRCGASPALESLKTWLLRWFEEGAHSRLDDAATGPQWNDEASTRDGLKIARRGRPQPCQASLHSTGRQPAGLITVTVINAGEEEYADPVPGVSYDIGSLQRSWTARLLACVDCAALCELSIRGLGVCLGMNCSSIWKRRVQMM